MFSSLPWVCHARPCREEIEAALEAAGLSVPSYQRKKPVKAFIKARPV